MNPITFRGIDAYKVARDTNLIPEVIDPAGSAWSHAKSLAGARAMAGVEPQSVRLIADARVLVEHLTKTAQPVDVGTGQLIAAVQTWAMSHPCDAADLILAALQGVTAS